MNESDTVVTVEQKQKLGQEHTNMLMQKQNIFLPQV